jgi:drug/metabolite transporter (DMT)-like permease
MLVRSNLSGLAAVAAVTIWGASFPAASVALESFSPGALACTRFALSSIIISALMILLREPLPPLQIILPVAILGFLGVGFTQLCISFGLTYSTSGDAAFIVSTSPIFVVLITYFIAASPLSWSSIFGVLVGALGLLVILVQSGFSIGRTGLLSITLASISLAVYTVLSPKYISKSSKYGLSLLQFLAIAMWSSTAFFATFWGLEAIEQMKAASFDALASTMFLALFSGVFAYWLFAYAQAHQNPVATSAAIYLEPPVATLIALIWLGEIPSTAAICGGALILVGVWFTSQGTVPKIATKIRQLTSVSGATR